MALAVEPLRDCGLGEIEGLVDPAYETIGTGIRITPDLLEREAKGHLRDEIVSPIEDVRCIQDRRLSRSPATENPVSDSDQGEIAEDQVVGIELAVINH